MVWVRVRARVSDRGDRVRLKVWVRVRIRLWFVLGLGIGG